MEIRNIGKSIIEESDVHRLSRTRYKTEHTGCQCFKDCTCKQDFISEEFFIYNLYIKELKESIRTRKVDVLNRIIKGLTTQIFDNYEQ